MITNIEGDCLMQYWIFAGIFVTVAGSILVGLPKARESSRSLSKFYLYDGELSSWSISHLLGASSMSLNGLFYHTYLGYKVGAYSLLIQAVWATSFFIFILKIDNFLELANRGSISGNISSFFGNSTGRLCAFAISLSMLAILGWEIAVAGTLGEDLFGFDQSDSLLAVLIMIAVAAMYTLRGGIYANRKANELQNWAGAIAFVLIFFLAIALWFNSQNLLEPFGQLAEPSWEQRLKLSPVEASIALGGGAALLCNLFFSFFWQQAEATSWQNISSGLDNGAANNVEAKKSIKRAALKVFLFPGLAGTILGMTLAGVPDLTDADIMPKIFTIFGSLPMGEVIAFLLAIMLSAAMLSTLDGLLLGISYTINRDVLKNKAFEDIVIIEDDNEKSRYQVLQERKIISHGKLIIVFAAALSIVMYLLIQKEILDLFQAVYVAVTAQMAVTPLVLSMLFKRSTLEDRGGKKFAWAAVLLGLLAGYFCIGKFLTGHVNAFVTEIDWIGSVMYIFIAPPIAFLVSAITLKFLPYKTAKIKE